MNNTANMTLREKRQESHTKHNEKHNQQNHAYEYNQGIKMHLIVDKLLTSSKRTKDSEVDSARMA